MADEQIPGAGAAAAAKAAAESADQEGGAASGAECAEVPPPAERLAAAQAEIEGLRDHLLRVQAEAENVRRRAQRDVENAHKFALEKFCAELVPVVDSLEKAVEITRKFEGGDIAAITAGVELSLRMFLGAMAKAGIEQLNPLGEPFDPQRHEAMAMVPNPHAEPNSVMDVMQKGYLLNGRLVRAAMVVVSKSPG